MPMMSTDMPSNAVSETKPSKLLEIFLLPVALSLAIFIPQWRYGFGLADEGLLWYLSQRVHAGDLPIRDFFGYDPGRYFWTSAWFHLLSLDGLLEQRIANAAFGAIGLMFACYAMRAMRIPRYWRLAAACMLAFAMGFPGHKTYEQALSLIAVAMVLIVLIRPAATWRWVAFGVSAGLAAVIGRNSGIYFLVAAGLSLAWALRDSTLAVTLRRVFFFGAGAAIGFAPILYLLASDARFRLAFIASVREVANWQLPLPIPFPWRSHGSLDNLFAAQQLATSWLCVIVIAIYVVAAIRLARCWHRRELISPAGHLEAAALFAGMPYLHHAFDRADFSHIAQGILPVFLLAAAQLAQVQRVKLVFKAQYVVLLAIGMLAWLPFEPRIHAHLANRAAPGSLRSIDIAGHTYIIDSQAASIMQATRQAVKQCGLRDGALLEAPHYPGLYAYMHLRAPIWETYFLYQRLASFQQAEIGDLEKWRPSVVLVNERTTVDGIDALYLKNSNPVLLAYIHDHYVDAPPASQPGGDAKIMTRDCNLVAR
jgi:hypothetical protein